MKLTSNKAKEGLSVCDWSSVQTAGSKGRKKRETSFPAEARSCKTLGALLKRLEFSLLENDRVVFLLCNNHCNSNVLDGLNR